MFVSCQIISSPSSLSFPSLPFPFSLPRSSLLSNGVSEGCSSKDMIINSLAPFPPLWMEQQLLLYLPLPSLLRLSSVVCVSYLISLFALCPPCLW